jgi:CubicO group peptidase (beta-lactamase class C family)
VIPEEISLIEPAAVGFDPAVLAEIRPAIEELRQRQRLAGAVVAILRRGHVAFFEAIGSRDVAGQIPLERDSIFRIFSMTKPLTSLAVLKLAERGSLDLDAPLEHFLPPLAGRQVLQSDGVTQIPARRSLTPRDLLRHTAGMPYGALGRSAGKQLYQQSRLLDHQNDLSSLVNKLAALPLVAQPGERFTYGVATDLLGRLIEVVSGQPFDQFLSHELLVPLGMHETGFSVPPDSFDRFLELHGRGSGGGLAVMERPESSRLRQQPRFLSGGGGLISTAADYIRFCRMLLAHGRVGESVLVQPATIQALIGNQLLGSAYPITIADQPQPHQGFGLGVSVVCQPPESPSGPPVGEYGWGGAASTHFWVSPRDELAVIALSQVMPFTLQLENRIKPIVYRALRDRR